MASFLGSTPLLESAYQALNTGRDTRSYIPSGVGGQGDRSALSSLGFPSSVANPSYWGTGFSGNGGGFGGGGNVSSNNNASSNTNSRFNASSFGDVFSNIMGGGGIDFGGNTPEGFNPYQFTPTFQDLQRPSSPVAGLTPEEEYLRQYQMGQLLGDQPGYDTAFNELMKTVGGDYLDVNSNPYLQQQIGAIGEDTSTLLNRSINDILSRAGTAGALGGSRSALMQGQAGGEAARGFEKTVADLLAGNYQNERNRQLGAAPGLAALEQLPIQQVAQAMGLAGIPREMQQKYIDASMQELMRQQNERLMPIQVGQSVLGQRMGQTIPIVQPQSSTLAGLGALASGVGNLAGGFGNLFGGTNAAGTTSSGAGNTTVNPPNNTGSGGGVGGLFSGIWDWLTGWTGSD